MTTIVDGNSGGTALTDTTITTYVPSGVIFPYAGSSAPTGFLLCYGQTVSRTTYAALFAAIGTTFGAGDGSTTFALPDLRGRSMFGKDNMGGSAANRVTNAASGITGTTLGAAGGDQNLAQHNHSASSSSTSISMEFGTYTPAVTQRAAFGDGNNAQFRSDGNTAHSHTITVNNAGTGTAANMPPAMIMNFIIKV